MLNLISWLAGSKTGKWIGAALLTLGTIAVVLLRVFAAGKAKERLRNTQYELESLQTALEVDHEIDKLTPEERRDRLRSHWMRKPAKRRE